MIDLIDECGKDLLSCGYVCDFVGKFGVTSCKLCVDSKKKAKEYGFGVGKYFIVNAPNLSLLMNEHKNILKSEIAKHLEYLFREQKLKKKDKILFVGIGNPKIVADSFGCLTVEKIPIESFRKTNRIFKIVPNTFSNTGIGAYDMIRLVVEFFGISAVVLFDSLMTNNIDRLGCSIQMNDAGLTPGSALNNFGKSINKETLNVPCISIGIPMMISSKSMGQKKEVIFTEKDVEEKMEYLSEIVATVISGLV